MQFLRGYGAFLDYKYWFNTHPVPLGPTLVGGIFVFFGWFFIAGLVFRVVAHLLRKKDQLKSGICKRLASLLMSTSLLGLLCLFFAYEQLPLFGMRAWFLGVFILFIIWLASIAAYIVREYPVERQAIADRKKLEKYMPGKKK